MYLSKCVRDIDILGSEAIIDLICLFISISIQFDWSTARSHAHACVCLHDHDSILPIDFHFSFYFDSTLVSVSHFVHIIFDFIVYIFIWVSIPLILSSFHSVFFFLLTQRMYIVIILFRAESFRYGNYFVECKFYLHTHTRMSKTKKQGTNLTVC